MTYNMLMGTLNPTHSLTHSLTLPLDQEHRTANEQSTVISGPRTTSKLKGQK